MHVLKCETCRELTHFMWSRTELPGMCDMVVDSA